MKKETLYQQHLKEKREEDKELIVYAIKNLQNAERALGKLMLKYLSEKTENLRETKRKNLRMTMLIDIFPVTLASQSGSYIKAFFPGGRSKKDIWAQKA